MQVQDAQSGHDAAKRNRRGRESRLWLVGGEDAFRNEACRFFNGHRFQIAGQSTTLLDALAHLELEAIDLVLLNSEFREEELSLFTFDAKRRGFPGLILRVASMPNGGARVPPSGAPMGQQRWKGESREHSESGAAERNRLSAPLASPSPGAHMELSDPYGSPSFTAKEQAVLTHVSEGWTNQQIAHHLQCSEGSVKAILQQLFKKLGVRKRARVVRMAFENAFAHIQEISASNAPAVYGHDGGLQAVTGAGDGLPRRPEIEAKESGPVHAGDFVVDELSHRAWIRGVEAQFTPREFELLTFFSKHPNELLSHNDLLAMLWGNPEASRDALRVLIQALRAKIETTTPPRYIVTQRHFGYRFFPAPLAVP